MTPFKGQNMALNAYVGLDGGEIGYAHVSLPNGQTIVVQVNGETNVGNGEAVSLTLSPQQIHVFGENGRALSFEAT